MNYSKEEVMQFAAEEDVKFIRLAFCDVYGRQKNISILSEELPRAFDYGIAIDASAIAGFGVAEQWAAVPDQTMVCIRMEQIQTYGGEYYERYER